VVQFAIEDHAAKDLVTYRGDLPDLFREGQGVVTRGAFRTDGVFEASEVLAKHDERYMPKEVTRALKASGEWRGGS
jgi:cytochrome c-type biogenesis protein CcmE